MLKQPFYWNEVIPGDVLYVPSAKLNIDPKAIARNGTWDELNIKIMKKRTASTLIDDAEFMHDKLYLVLSRVLGDQHPTCRDFYVIFGNGAIQTIKA